MTLKTKQYIIGVLGSLFLISLLFVQWMEVARKRDEVGLTTQSVSTPSQSVGCVKCHSESSPGIIDHWRSSTHARKGVGCVACHEAKDGDADGFDHHGWHIATIVTPRDCGRCHKQETLEFANSHHSKAGDILDSLDNRLAEVVEGSTVPFNPHSPTPGRPEVTKIDGMASTFVGCMQCHGSKVALLGKDGSRITVDDLKPNAAGQPTALAVMSKVVTDRKGRPKYHPGTWPNTGIGRINLDGSRGSCSACHSRHDFSPRRARQPENCSKCHLGPDHPQKEIYEESKHGVAFRDLKDRMNLDAHKWVLGETYSQAPTCATCHMSGHSKNGGKVTHDPCRRISWSNRPPVSMVMDTGKDGQIIDLDEHGKFAPIADPAERRRLLSKKNGGKSTVTRRNRMKLVCAHCHTPDYIDGFYKQYDDFLMLYNEKFAKPGQAIMAELQKQELLTKPQFDEEIEWTWFYLWHHEGRRARHGASMMAPDYAHWHGMFEVAERFYQELIPQAQELADHAEKAGDEEGAAAVRKVIDDIFARPEHAWKNAAKKKPKKKPKGAAAGD